MILAFVRPPPIMKGVTGGMKLCMAWCSSARNKKLASFSCGVYTLRRAKGRPLVTMCNQVESMQEYWATMMPPYGFFCRRVCTSKEVNTTTSLHHNEVNHHKFIFLKTYKRNIVLEHNRLNHFSVGCISLLTFHTRKLYSIGNLDKRRSRWSDGYLHGLVVGFARFGEGRE